MAGLMVEDRAPLATYTGFSKGPSALQERGIAVVLERKDSQTGQTVIASALLDADTSISQIILKGRAKGWFKTGDKLVLGGRELLGHETLSHLQRESNAGLLHVYVKLSDLNTFTVKSPGGTKQTFATPGNQASKSRSALTAALAACPAEGEADCDSLLVKGLVLDNDHPLPHLEARGDDVLHLVIRRPSKVEYRISKDTFELTVGASDDIKSIKEKVEAQHGLPAGSHSLLYNGQALCSGSLASYGVRKGCVLELIPVEPAVPAKMPQHSPVLSSPQHELNGRFLQATAGLAAGSLPQLAPAGTGGSYFISNTFGEKIAVLKPADEEPGARNNPRGHSSVTDEGFRRGVHPGEGAVREVAAFLLDHQHFAGVPPTALVACQEARLLPHSPATHPAKLASLQAFVTSDGDCEERGTGVFDVEQVHKIAILDMRLGNCDRNAGNILVRECSDGKSCRFELIPIDHGYCLPSTFEDIQLEWRYWPQAAKPFSQKSKEYIAGLDVEKDEQTLKAHDLQLRPQCNRVRKVCTMLLKKACVLGLTPADIAGLMCRDTLQKSPLEKTHSVVLGFCHAERPHEEVDETLYLGKMSSALDDLLDNLL